MSLGSRSLLFGRRLREVGYWTQADGEAGATRIAATMTPVQTEGEHQQPRSARCAAPAAAAGGAGRPRCRPPGPAARGQHVHADAEERGEHVIDDGRRASPIGLPRPSPPYERNAGRARTRRPRQPGEAGRAAPRCRPAPTASEHQVARTGGDTVGDTPAGPRAGRRRQREPDLPGSRWPCAIGLPVRWWRGRGCWSTRSLCQPRIAWPTRTVAKTRPTSRAGGR
jgi:hypothetical protein